jgi:hypothetical protein
MRKRITLVSLPVLTLIIFLGFYFFDFSAQSSSRGPIQPIRFSHKIHAGMDNDQLPCQYCHSYVAISPNPGIPSLKKCMGCHTHIVGRDVNFNFDGTTINIKNEITKVRDYWEKKQPIAWNKVNPMPGYVHFTHKRHIQRGFQCNVCHGDVANMNQVYQVHRLDMGFCIQCHTHNAKNQEELNHLKDCLTCHY